MLILTRKTGEVIKIGDQVKLHVIEINKGFVKLGIEAPEDVRILREEVFERVKAENIESAKGTAKGLMKAASMMKKKGSSLSTQKKE